MRAYVVRDPALTETWTLVIELGARELYVYPRGRRLKVDCWSPRRAKKLDEQWAGAREYFGG